jgi:hypothetical protein
MKIIKNNNNLIKTAPEMLSLLNKINKACVGTNEDFVKNLCNIPKSDMSFKTLIESIIDKAEGK